MLHPRAALAGIGRGFQVADLAAAEALHFKRLVQTGRHWQGQDTLVDAVEVNDDGLHLGGVLLGLFSASRPPAFSSSLSRDKARRRGRL